MNIIVSFLKSIISSVLAASVISYFMKDQEKAYNEFHYCLGDMLSNKDVRQMDRYIQHSDISCLRHCMHVSFVSFLICKKFHLNARDAARGALLHDMFLYDWHKQDKFSFHGFKHPSIALKNAEKTFGYLGNMESDIILNHMWPLTIYRAPRHKETFIVTLADKFCTILEVLKIRRFIGVDAVIYDKYREKNGSIVKGELSC